MDRRWELEEYLSGFEYLYPGIMKWYRSSLSGVHSGERSIFGVMVDDRLSGLAITRNGKSAKLCHISLHERLQNQGVGLSLARLAINSMLETGARTIRVTTSEEVTAFHGGFFSRLGFSPTAQLKGAYRTGRYETIWGADSSSLVSLRPPKAVSGHNRFIDTSSLDPEPYSARWSTKHWEPWMSIPLLEPLGGQPRLRRTQQAILSLG